MLASERVWLSPLGIIYGEVMELRNLAYDWGWISTTKLNCPVISIGNLTVGGTGKTPLTLELARRLKLKGHRVGIVSRGYKGTVKTSARVSPRDPRTFGDEPALLAAQLVDVPVYVGANRVLAAAQLLAVENVDVIIADDAFQHRRLARDLDIITVDTTQPPNSQYPLPWGLAREKSRHAQRADLIFFTKVNLASDECLRGWRAWRQRWAPEVNTVEVEYAAAELIDLDGQRVTTKNLSEPMALMTGIARPQSFVDLLARSLSLIVKQQFLFRDHHVFSMADLDSVAKSFPVGKLLITEKDAIKLKGINHHLLQRMVVVPLQLKFQEGVEAIDGAIDRLFR